MDDPVSYFLDWFHADWRLDFREPLDLIRYVVENHNSNATMKIVDGLESLIEQGVHEGFLREHDVSCNSFRGSKTDLEVIKQLHGEFLVVLKERESTK